MRVVVLNTRALHLGYLGCYGGEWVSTPNLDRLASEGVVFDQHLADCPKLASPPRSIHRSAWTGRFGPPLVPDTATENVLAELLASREIPCAFLTFGDWNAVLNDSWSKKLGGSDRCLLWLDLPSLAPPWHVGDDERALLFRETEADEEEEPLTPWLDPPAGAMDPEGLDFDRARTTYAAVVAGFDRRIGEILGALRKDGQLDKALLVVTADCGLALGEHGFIGEHRAWLHDEVLHVPLVMRLPEAAEAGRRVSALTQPIDLFATLLEAFALPARVNHGYSLWPLLRDERERVRPYACAGLQVGESVEWALRTPEWAFLLPLQTPTHDRPRPPQLYVKPDDRWEVNNVRQHHPELVEQMEKTLQAFATAARHPGPLEYPELRMSSEGDSPDAA